MSLYTYNSIPKNKFFEPPVYMSPIPQQKIDNKKINMIENDINKLKESFEMLHSIVQEQ